MDLLGLGSYGSDSEKEEEHEEVHPGIKASIPISAAPDSPPCDAPRTFSAAPAEPESLQAETVHKTQERVELQPAERSFVKVPSLVNSAVCLCSLHALSQFHCGLCPLIHSLSTHLVGGTTRGWTYKSTSRTQLSRVGGPRSYKAGRMVKPARSEG